MDNNSIYKRVENHVNGLFEKMKDPTLAFHNLKHTQMVVERTKEIAGHYNLSEDEMLIVFIAAWFHDTGHLFTDSSRHEDMSAELMKKFMFDLNDKQHLVPQIEQCILSTKFPRHPTSLLHQILCDADTYHFGTKDFKITNKCALEEYNLVKGGVNRAEFNKNTIKMLEDHEFYTTYCKDLLSDTKAKNLKKLKKKKFDDEVDVPVTATVAPASGNSSSTDLGKLEKDKSGLMSKGIQTMLRLTSENHLKLSDMADHKANILISVNSIIISVILTVLLRKLQDEPYLIIPTIIFLLSAVITIVISILATRPKISGGTFTPQDIQEKKTNLLFFGNFHKASFEEYNMAMREMMVDTDYLYGSLIKDIYSLGTVLGKKYRLIRIAYNVFMVGLIISIVAFAIAEIFNHSTPSGTVVNASGSPL